MNELFIWSASHLTSGVCCQDFANEPYSENDAT